MIYIILGKRTDHGGSQSSIFYLKIIGESRQVIFIANTFDLTPIKELARTLVIPVHELNTGVDHFIEVMKTLGARIQNG